MDALCSNRCRIFKLGAAAWAAIPALGLLRHAAINAVSRLRFHSQDHPKDNQRYAYCIAFLLPRMRGMFQAPVASLLDGLIEAVGARHLPRNVFFLHKRGLL
jgi:hypothetical protein